MCVPFRWVCTGAFSPRKGLDFHQILGGQCVWDEGGQGGGIFSQGLARSRSLCGVSERPA